MPQITYKPDGAEPKVWKIPFGRFMSAERIVIERETGMTWAQLKGRLFDEDTAVIRAFLWVLLKRDIPTLKIDQVEFCEDDILLDATAEERAQLIEVLEANVGKLAPQELYALETLRAAQALDGDEDPKEPESTSGSDSAS